MKVFLWIAFLIVIAVAIFAIQNSGAPIITVKFLFWKFETSLVYIILGSVGLGILFTLLFWVPRALRASFRSKKKNQGLPSTPEGADQ
jgi:uncharacterized integral membrane protein